MHVIPDVDSKFEGNVEVGGLLLAKQQLKMSKHAEII